MREELNSSVAKILHEWNPLGEKAKNIPDLHGYKYEAMDILSTIAISKAPVEKAVSQVLTQAFGISLDDDQLIYYSLKIKQLTNVQ